ncbi:MAG: M3 family oligoendopeptidase [Anaerolineales bacterium]|jgi:oligoendopeptidase F
MKSPPNNALDALDWPWEKYEPYFEELAERKLDSDKLKDWMLDWSHMEKLLNEVEHRLWVATTVNTTDKKAAEMYHTFLDKVYPPAKTAGQKLKEKLLDSGLEPENFAVQLREMRTQADLYREENLPLLSEDKKMDTVYDKIVGDQTVEWEGKDITLIKLHLVQQDQDREKREKSWRLAMERWQQDRQAIDELWVKFMNVRGQIARNAGYDSYRDYRWREMLRLDFTPEDCLRFDESIEKAAVPAALRAYERRKERLGLDRLRPWDLYVDPLKREPLRPYKELTELIDKCSTILHKVDPELGGYFDIMREEGLLDLENRKGKGPSAYCIEYQLAKRPFIFMNAVGLHEDVQTLLHESGHAFHVFEASHLPYFHQLIYGFEIAEVASTSMELLTAPYLLEDEGGFYSMKEAARARIEHLEEYLLFWPYMAVVDSFQHWVYENHEAASDPANCDAHWTTLWDRYMKGVDWSGLEVEKASGWHRKLHIFEDPFYYVDYGLAQLGAVQVWANSLRDQAEAVRKYRSGLALGATRPLPELFEACGAKLAFDAETLGEVVGLIEQTIQELEMI